MNLGREMVVVVACFFGGNGSGLKKGNKLSDSISLLKRIWIESHHGKELLQEFLDWLRMGLSIGGST